MAALILIVELHRDVDVLFRWKNKSKKGGQVVRTSMADIVTLDCKRISGKGIISGSSYKVR